MTAGDSVKPNEPALADLFATDIAIWLRVHASTDWNAEHEAVRGLAARLVRVAAAGNQPSVNLACPCVAPSGRRYGVHSDCTVHHWITETKADANAAFVGRVLGRVIELPWYAFREREQARRTVAAARRRMVAGIYNDRTETTEPLP